MLEGSRIHLEVPAAVLAALVKLDGSAESFSERGERRVLDFTAVESRPLLIRFDSAAGSPSDRLVHLRVQPDDRPIVRIEQPAKDLIFPESTGDVAVTISARDDVRLEALALRYTKVSGSGENFMFEEGEWPLRIERPAAGDWTAQAKFSLSALNLQDGDTLVYRAVARDGKPGADPALSDSFLIEVGRLAGVASTGFALPEERDRQAISQQMLIIKTERLQAERAKLSEAAFIEQARLLAIEQRMVKAEFEFMTGGVVEDEIEEATHSHELAEGRLENTGQLELITAIREMSRAEARLNSAATTEALVNERAALRALQRAFDRRRYLLRTLPERARIDLSRRLSGDLDTARSSTQPPGATNPDPFLDRARDVLRELSEARAPINPPALASRLLALDPASEELQKAALQVAAARDTCGPHQRHQSGTAPGCRVHAITSCQGVAVCPQPGSDRRAAGAGTFRIPAMMVENGLRLLAIAIAIAAFVDPAITRSMPQRQALRIVTMHADDVVHAERLQRRLSADYDVTIQVDNPTSLAAACPSTGGCLLVSRGDVPRRLSAGAVVLGALRVTAEGSGRTIRRIAVPQMTHLDAASSLHVALTEPVARVDVLDGGIIVGSAEPGESLEVDVTWVPLGTGARTLRVVAGDDVEDVGVVVADAPAAVFVYEPERRGRGRSCDVPSKTIGVLRSWDARASRRQ